MKKDKIFLLLVVIMVVLSMILFTSVGYAVEDGNIIQISDNVLFSPEYGSFRIAFIGEPTYSGTGEAILKLTSSTTANINVTNLKTIGDYVTAEFEIQNQSNDINAQIYSEVFNTNQEYFEVTSSFSENVVGLKDGTTILEVTVKLIRLPISREEKADITINIVASPIY